MDQENPIKTWLSHIGGAVAGVFLGWIPFLGAIVLLFWNEGRAVKTERALSEGSAIVIPIAPDRVTVSNEHRLVHVQGLATTKETLADPLFGVSVQALRLRRVVETYQWREKEEIERKDTASERTKRTKQVTYRYEQTWSDTLIDSSRFKTPAGHQNPTSIPFPSAEWAASTFELGAFRLESALRDQLNDFNPLGVRVGEPAEQVRQLGFRPLIASFYRGDNSSYPQIGDVRVVFEAVMPTEVSVIAAQKSNTLAPYRTKGGGELALLRSGKFSAAEMFRDAQLWNWIMMWVYRVAGYFLMLLGVRMVLRPVSLLAEFLPGLFGGLSSISSFLGFLFATAVTLIVTSLAWLAYRPQFGLSLLATGVLLGFLVVWRVRRRHQARTVMTDTDRIAA